MEWYYLIILLLATTVFWIIYDMQQEIAEHKDQIDKLHLECENYLQLLSRENIIPEIITEEKVKQMNKKYGEIKLKIK